MTEQKPQSKNAGPADNATEFNRDAWEKIAEQGDRLFHVASSEQIEAARSGMLDIKLTPTKKVPSEWLSPINGLDVLCLAGGGGLQGPILAAAGANVTVTDISHSQLERDDEVARRENLVITTVAADMCTLEPFADESFDLIINPTAICYVPDPTPVWNSCHRVLRKEGTLISGNMNPVNFLFDIFQRDRGLLEVANRIPYCDLNLPEEQQERVLAADRPVEFSHTLTSLIGGQINAGFRITGFYEDRWGGKDCVSDLIDVFFVTRSGK
ncbi:MAG: class I SAM-dependent methyltransferase [Planctomycetota bacterium]